MFSFTSGPYTPARAADDTQADRLTTDPYGVRLDMMRDHLVALPEELFAKILAIADKGENRKIGCRDGALAWC